MLQAWVHFHNGDFQKASETGLAAGGAGITAANKAAAIATYLEKRKNPSGSVPAGGRTGRGAGRCRPENANAWYWHAYALGRYSQGISVAKGPRPGLGGKIRSRSKKKPSPSRPSMPTPASRWAPSMPR